MSTWQFAAFLGCVALASTAQALTGFAMSLVLLGLTGVLNLAPVADVANVASVVTLASAAVAFRGGSHHVDAGIFRSTIAGTVLGVVAGVALLGWLSTGTAVALKLLLGLTVIACAAVVLLRTQALPQRSPPPSFTAIGALSGVLGGLFSASGPPLVYHLYRQPIALETARDTLVAIFAISGSLRLALVVFHGLFSAQALLLCAGGVPVAMGVTWLMRRHPPPLSRAAILRLVCALLSVTGLGLAVPAARTIAATIGH